MIKSTFIFAVFFLGTVVFLSGQHLIASKNKSVQALQEKVQTSLPIVDTLKNKSKEQKSVNSIPLSISRNNGSIKSRIQNEMLAFSLTDLGKFQLGIGFGIPYGIVGFNMECHIIRKFSITGGLGSSIFAGRAYNIGLKAYISEPKSIKKAMSYQTVSAYYGINGIYIADLNSPQNKKYPGLSIGFGNSTFWGRHGFEANLFLIATSKVFKAQGITPVNNPVTIFEKINNRVKLSFGYTFLI